MNQRMPGPRVIRPRRGAPSANFADWQDSQQAEAAQQAALDSARAGAGLSAAAAIVPATPVPRMAILRAPEQRDSRPRVIQLEPQIYGNGRTPENIARQESYSAPNADFTVEQLRATGISDAELVQLGRIPGPSDATADELRAQGYGEPYITGHASNVRAPTPPRTADGEIRRLSAMTPELPDGGTYPNRAPVVRRGAMDIPAMPSSAPSLDEGYAVRDGRLLPRAQPATIPEGYAVTSDGQVLPRAEATPMSFVPTELGATQSEMAPQDYAAMRSMPQAPTLVAGGAQFDPMVVEAGSAQLDPMTMEAGGAQMTPRAVPRAGVPRRATAPYVAGLPNAPGGTAEMPSALAPNGIDALMGGSGMRTPQRSPLDTQRDTLALDVRYAQQRAQDAQAAGEGIADVEIARQRRLEQNEMDRQRAEGRARQAVQRAADRAASIRIDPSRAMQGASGIANIIAVVLGGIGSGVTGGPNQALGMVQANIERDLAAQRTDLDTARNAVADQQSILGNIRQEFQSREAADEMFRVNALRQAAAQVEIQAQRTNGAEAGGRASNLREQIANEEASRLAAAERAELTFLLASGKTEAEINNLNARSRGANATAATAEGANARRALMSMRPRAPYGSMEEWRRLTPAQQATRMQNAQDAQLTGTSLVDSLTLAGVPQGGIQGERVPVENGARSPAGGGAGSMVPFDQADSIEQGRRLTNANTMMQSGIDAPTASDRAGVPVGYLERQAVAPEQALRLSAADNALRTLEGAIARSGQEGNGIAGVGLLDNSLPGVLSSDEALQNRIAIAGAIDSFIRVSSGANAPETEVQRQRDMIIGDGTERALAAGVQYLRGQLDAQLGNTAGIGSQSSVQSDVASGLGLTSRVAQSSGVMSATPAPVRPRLIPPSGGGMGNLE